MPSCSTSVTRSLVTKADITNAGYIAIPVIYHLGDCFMMINSRIMVD